MTTLISHGMVNEYLSDIKERFKDGNNATEHTHRPALQTLIENLLDGVMATNEPQRIACGAPDFIITDGPVPIGYIEAKDLDVDLEEQEQTDQLTRYLGSLDNLILTNYFEFRWYIKGKLTSSCSIASLRGKKIEIHDENFGQLIAMLEAFRRSEIPVIKSASELAERLAGSTRSIYELIKKAYTIEPATGYLHKWLDTFKSVLIADLEVDRFSDMFAQTLVYGFFSARAYQTERDSFSRESASRILPETNPFLRRLFHEFAGLDMPRIIDWAIDEVVELLKRTDVELVMKDFGARSGKNDPVFHFYETFLTKYNPELKDAMGAYYTPKPVIDYIVKSVDKTLKKHFQREKGLADKNTLILDPATGTGSFLYQVIDEIRGTLKGQEGTWPQYVAEHLLNRVYGFEIMMAPYSVAHLKIGNQLKASGYKFDSGKRLGIFLTNTLDEAARKTDSFFAEFVSKEANEAAAIKADRPIVAVLGNPPYKQFSENQGEWIQTLMEDYKDDLGEKKNNGDNDYMKFIRFAQWRIDRTKYGVAAFITPNTFLDGITLRQMRSSLLDSFSDIYVLNLHGSAMVENETAKAAKDKNVFDISQGVAISIFIKREEPKEKKTTAGTKESCKVHYHEIFGSREQKYKFLQSHDIETTTWTPVTISKDRNFFIPGFEKNDLYSGFVSIRDIFPLNTSGIQPKKKEIAIQFTEAEMRDVISDLALLDAPAFTTKYKVEDSKGWKVEWAQAHAKDLTTREQKPTRIQYRTFDYRWTVIDDYSSGIVGRPRYDVMKHMKRPKNLGLVALRQLSQSSFYHAWVTRAAIDENTISRKTREYNYLFPLYLVPDEGQITTHQQRVNISDRFRTQFASTTSLKFTDGVEGDFKTTISPEQFFHYAYGILNSPSYRKEFFKELKIDFPRIPIFADKEFIKKMSNFGKELTELHLLEHSTQQNPAVTFPIAGTNKVESLKFMADPNAAQPDDKKSQSKLKRIYINKTQYFDNVDEDDWKFRVGGHEVLREFFTDRDGRTLTSDDVETIRMIATAFTRTRALMIEIDKAIVDHGGWTQATAITIAPAAVVDDSADETKTKKKKKKKPAA